MIAYSPGLGSTDQGSGFWAPETSWHRLLTSALSILRVDVACSSPLALASAMTVSEVSMGDSSTGRVHPPGRLCRAGYTRGTPRAHNEEEQPRLTGSLYTGAH